MGCRIISDPVDNVAAFYDSVSGIAFGPIFDNHVDAQEAAEDFLDWLDMRMRREAA